MMAGRGRDAYTIPRTDLFIRRQSNESRRLSSAEIQATLQSQPMRKWLQISNLCSRVSKLLRMADEFRLLRPTRNDTSDWRGRPCVHVAKQVMTCSTSFRVMTARTFFDSGTTRITYARFIGQLSQLRTCMRSRSRTATLRKRRLHRTEPRPGTRPGRGREGCGELPSGIRRRTRRPACVVMRFSHTLSRHDPMPQRQPVRLRHESPPTAASRARHSSTSA